VPLHTTLVRNEAAYYGCVAQLLGQHPPPPPSPPLQLPATAPNGSDAGPTPGAVDEAPRTSPPAASASSPTPPIYLIGDSHSLSREWGSMFHMFPVTMFHMFTVTMIHMFTVT
jgi:hypothetical protein